MTVQLPAQEALCRLLAAAWDPTRRPAADVVPWPELLPLAGAGGVAATLYAATRDMPLPIDVQEALAQAFYATAAANTRGLHQLAQVGAALAAAGAPLLLLKGAALAEALYADPALRPFGDIDLLIPHASLPACRDALLRLGYAPAEVEHQPGAGLAYRNEESFLPPAADLAPVELHWHLLDVPYYLRRVPVAWFWEHSEPRTIAGQPFRVLTPEANLVYLPAHLALHHQFQGLRSLLDLALLIVKHGDRLDWAGVFAAARAFELLAALRQTLERLAQCWPSLPLDGPRQQAHALRPTRTDERLFRLLSAASRSATLDFYTTLVSLPDAAARARYAWFNLFPQPAYMRERYKVAAGWQLPYWYLYRLAAGLPRLAAIVPRARRIERG